MMNTRPELRMPHVLGDPVLRDLFTADEHVQV